MAGQKRSPQSAASKSAEPRHVLVADDGSPSAARARDFALMLAAMSGARLTAVYVPEPTEDRQAAAAKLAPTRAAATAAKVRCTLVIERPIGITNAGRRILEVAARQRADLIVVGARGSGLARKLLGSVSSYVVSRASVSVSIVR